MVIEFGLELVDWVVIFLKKLVKVGDIVELDVVIVFDELVINELMIDVLK